eukprot:TRINITY_DN9290_c0_g1_i5.p1 TRINITY_DN9290_c0_g1~~TRINITY_DN9290_c0_g1_i5.p1  ORF type:complete len:859 (+),score=117.64 TRINITY_DN9290_c0_g1_i5:17-2593(+)
METKKLLILIAFICVTSIVIGLLVCVTVGLGIWLTPMSTVEYEFAIDITSALPPGQAFSNGYIELQLSLPRDIRVERNILVYLDGVEKYSFKVFPSYLQIPTQGLVDGYHTVTVVVVSSTSSKGIGEITVLVEDPMISFVTIDYPRVIYPGLQVIVSIEISGNASHFVANYSSIFGQSTIMNSTIQNGNILIGSILIPYNLVAVERFYTIPLVVYSTDERTLMVPGIEVFFQLGTTNPFSIDEGIIDMKSFPLTEATNSTDSTLNVTVPQNFTLSITTGQSVQVPFQIEEGSSGSELLVGFEGLGQHFIIPISSLQNGTSVGRRSTRQSGTQTISFSLDLPPGAIESGEEIAMLLRLRNMVGELGPIQRITTLTSKSERGILHVRLTWDQEVDMDIHVVDPNNEEIFYAARFSTIQEGFLDLDSNAACNIDRIRIENIFYSMAVSGQYIIRVDLWSACSVSDSINYEVLVEGCDVMQTVTGSFLPQEADEGGAGSGREVLVFNTSCNEYLAEGTVSYKTPMSRFNPLGSVVRVVDAAGNELGTSEVERDVTDARRGVYSVSYEPTDVDSAVYVEFLSTNNKIKVTDHSEVNTHVYRVTSEIVPSAEVMATRDVVINTDDGSGAFHIMVTLTRGLPLYLSYGGQVADYPRIANWENGKYAKGTDNSASYFYGGTIYVGGHETDPDQFDDSVLLHEFGHLINARTGAVITGGGPHDGSPITPNFAFSEGYATYLGQKVIGNLVYCDGWCSDLSNLADRYLGTTAANDASSGDISEFLVASVAFKLDDQIGLGALMRQSLTDPNKLLLEANYNRLGTLNAVDFSDMVSIVVCPLDAAQRNPSSVLLNDNDLPWIQEVDFCA